MNNQIAQNEMISSKPPTRPQTPKRRVLVKKIDQDSARLFEQIKDRINKKPYGRKIKDFEIMAVAIKQITAEHIKELQAQTFTEKDNLAIAHEEYQKANGKISLDQFIGKLLKGQIKSQGA